MPTRCLPHLQSLATLLIAAAGAAATLDARAADLTVEIDAGDARGEVRSALYGSPESWLDATRAARTDRTPSAGRTVVVYRDLPPGRYALSAYRDDNANGAMDRNVVGMPTERYGFSRDARGSFGPPSFDDAAIELTGDMRVTLQLK